MSDLDEISLVLSPTERYLNPRQLQDYRAEREACIRQESEAVQVKAVPSYTN
jgi:hypothetical protein